MTVDLSPNTGAAVPFVGTQSLGLTWNTEIDTLQIKAAVKNNPFTRRGLLNHIMTQYYPFGLGEPVMRIAKDLQRKVTQMGREETELGPDTSGRHTPRMLSTTGNDARYTKNLYSQGI